MDLTDTNRVKRAMEWFKRTVFQDEAVQPRRQEEEPFACPHPRRPVFGRGYLCLPAVLESLFVMQAKVLANYEDDYVYDEPVLHYYPTYQSPDGSGAAGILFLADEATQGDVQKRLCPTHFFTSTSFSTKSASQILWTAARN